MTGTGLSSEIDFREIAPRLGGKSEAFEELCCQLARRSVGLPIVRLRGDGGDGGVECFVDLPDGRVGWQAKYVFDAGKLIRQATTSLATALSVHPELTKFILCFPFDPTGPTGRSRRSDHTRLADWVREREEEAEGSGRALTIELWPAFRLRELILTHDNSGGLRDYFFDRTHLSSSWFQRHVQRAQEAAKPRYTPEVNVETPLRAWFSAFGRTAEWRERLRNRLQCYDKVHRSLVSTSDSAHAPWPDDTGSATKSAVDRIEEALAPLRDGEAVSDDDASHGLALLTGSLEALGHVELALARDLNERNEKDVADSVHWRQFMAEYMCSFPAANLDAVRETIEALKELRSWLESPESFLAFRSAFVLSGEAGVGKTHAVCDIASQRLEHGLNTCIVFGHEFESSSDPWTRIAESLGLSPSLGMERLLDSLDAAGEASGGPVLLCIDAVNETRPLRYWKHRLHAVVHAVAQRAWVRVCVVCRTPFLDYCLPDDHGLPVVPHEGFAGMEWEACRLYFEHHGLEPPVFPVLHPELRNPLYLRLACSALEDAGVRRLPSNWSAMSRVVREFLDAKNGSFAKEKELPVGSRSVTKCLTAIARQMATEGATALPLSQAVEVLRGSSALGDPLTLMMWCVQEGLLIEHDATGNEGDEEVRVRPAFERLGDYLLASEILRDRSLAELDAAFGEEGRFGDWLRDDTAFAENRGVLAALSVLVPEKWAGVEFAELGASEVCYDELSHLSVRSLVERDPGSLGPAAERLVVDVLASRGRSFDAMDAVVGSAWRESALDADWLHGFLQGRSLVQRDGYWCSYLYDRFESGGAVPSLMEAALKMPLSDIEDEVARRWATLLLWFTASPDRRIKDGASRAAIAVLSARSDVIAQTLASMMGVDDDEVRERALLAAYGALVCSRDVEATGEVATSLYGRFTEDSRSFQNALIRDHIRCIGELAAELGSMPEGLNPELPSHPIDPSEWSPALPTDQELEEWGDAVRFWPDEFRSDFFKYTMERLRRWTHAVPKVEMGKWILERVARDFGYMRSDCVHYDRAMLTKFGGGRGRQAWAERIGKKYTWAAMAQLASRLHGQVPAKRERWEGEPLKRPLIFMEGREFDPTLPPDSSRESAPAGGPWQGVSVDLDHPRVLDDQAWVLEEADIPSMERVLTAGIDDERSWHPLVAHLKWGRRSSDSSWSDPYRQVWIQISGLLVQEGSFDLALKGIRRRNFYGRWMPERASFSYGFAGEYPWATPFNTFPDEEYVAGPVGRYDLPVDLYRPFWNTLVAEWQYDTSFESYHLNLPARVFFSGRDLWWNGRDGFRIVDGETVLRDPRMLSRDAPSSLLVEGEFVKDVLRSHGLRLIWTLLGERWIVGGGFSRRDDFPSPRTFSQVGYLDEDGVVRVCERVFFDDYDKDCGPGPPLKGEEFALRAGAGRQLAPTSLPTVPES